MFFEFSSVLLELNASVQCYSKELSYIDALAKNISENILLNKENIEENIRLVILSSHFDYPVQMKPLPWPWIRTALTDALSNHHCRS